MHKRLDSGHIICLARGFGKAMLLVANRYLVVLKPLYSFNDNEGMEHDHKDGTCITMHWDIKALAYSAATQDPFIPCYILE